MTADNDKSKAPKWVKAIIGGLILLLAYLFALNGKYMEIKDGFILNKWKGEVVHYVDLWDN